MTKKLISTAILIPSLPFFFPDLNKNDELVVDLSSAYQESELCLNNQKSLDSILLSSTQSDIEVVTHLSYATNIIWQVRDIIEEE